MLASQKRTRGGAWKDHWVAMLVELRGCMNDEFMKPQKQGVDMWTRVATEIAAACDGFDKDSESCRKKWQKVYKLYKEDKSRIIRSSGNNPRNLTCKWFYLVDKYMQSCQHVKCHSHASGTGELVFLDETAHLETAQVTELDPAQAQATCVDSAHTNQINNAQGTHMDFAQVNHVDSVRLTSSGHVAASQTFIAQDHTSHHTDRGDVKGNAKRARRDLDVEECLSQMAETWKDALEAMKEADARRIEVLQSLAVTMAGLLDVLKRW